ncbi:MAG: RluA family pseudouridine synthase [Patescibacteria group bacterium]
MKIIFEDENLLVIDKPPGVVVDKSETQKAETLEDFLASKGIALDRSGIVHRLDKDTSGVLLVAKTQKALESLQAQFKERKVKKEYLALVHGEVEKGGVVEGAIVRNPGNREKFTVVPPGRSLPRLRSGQASPPSRWPDGLLEGVREAVTDYEPMESYQFTGDRLQEIFSDFNKIQMRKLSTANYNLFTLLRCFPKTGRTHQIRVHLKYIGHPIVSDEKYTGRKMVRLDKRWCPRMFLHAKRLGFYHPVTGEWMEVDSKLPEDLTNCLKLLSRRIYG